MKNTTPAPATFAVELGGAPLANLLAACRLTGAAPGDVIGAAWAAQAEVIIGDALPAQTDGGEPSPSYLENVGQAFTEWLSLPSQQAPQRPA